jgi:pentapeptide MXKDX repeat protein
MVPSTATNLWIFQIFCKGSGTGERGDPSISRWAYNFARLLHIFKKETKMKKLITICFALCLLMCGVTLAQDSMKQDNMKADASAKPIDVTGKISKDGKMFVSDKDGKSWTITNPDAVKGHEGHHVTLNAHVYADKKEVHVMSLKMAADSMKNDSMQK